MSILKALGSRERRRITVCFLLAGLFLLMPPDCAGACSCAWNGPFLAVWGKSPLVVRAKVIGHHPGRNPGMDVLVLETLKGGLLDSGMVVQMGDGMQCRPAPEGFPPGSEWILALNGPGAKPGAGFALSHCGEYWLRVENGEVVGSIDGTQFNIRRMALDEFKRKIRYPRFRAKITGHIGKGQHFSKSLDSGFRFVLEPAADGWEICVREEGRDENLARLTPPLHFAPNPRDIEGWHFMKNAAECLSRPYDAEAGPANPREFIFSPEVGRRIDGPGAAGKVTVEEIEDIRLFGRGTMFIENFKLKPGENGCPRMEWIDFSVQIDAGY